MTNLQTRLKQLRKEKGITQSELAGVLGVKRSCIANWETGVRMPGSGDVRKLCMFFDVTADYLIGRVNARNRIIAPPVYNFDLGKLNNKGQEALHRYYMFLLTQEDCSNTFANAANAGA